MDILIFKANKLDLFALSFLELKQLKNGWCKILGVEVVIDGNHLSTEIDFGALTLSRDGREYVDGGYKVTETLIMVKPLFQLMLKLTGSILWLQIWFERNRFIC
jgi:hypothetical protein